MTSLHIEWTASVLAFALAIASPIVGLGVLHWPAELAVMVFVCTAAAGVCLSPRRPRILRDG